ncbi:type I DNA topoisomerase [Blastococcus sp. TF02A-26]|uniref:type I DNA topoisomerase n=1 Tax=Blastococcus sp. TF02A-26 TaxID=2250577 RepID=UPI000DE86F5A|nr:type I DNA topoisomerase [Blastococcus sp. TF02A-26]RBY84211.1 type I DNA topoisomerase [Blastococcus sp. TF02A-26]
MAPTKTETTETAGDTAGGTSTPARRRTAAAGGRPLVIVESPTKANKIAGYLGAGYVVEASVGHIRDLPRNAADVPAEHKGAAWARLGVDVDNSFEPLYVVSPDRKQQVSRLKQLVKQASEVYLATDEDREGEAIAWHLVDTLKPRVPVRRMVFHEITPEAIARAVANPRELDTALVDAQETRRILDRLYGYEVSPVLWKKVLPKLSAGRVQSVATRIVVERERERMAFHAADYWSLEGTFAVPGRTTGADAGEPTTLRAKLVSVDDSRVATGRDFDPATGRVTGEVVHLDEAGARGLAARLEGRQVTVSRVDEKPYRRRPYAPFTTSTLQMEAGRKLGWSSAQVMRVAQRLYENGHITYMRTDSTNLSNEAINAARTQARELYGDAYVPAEARRYAKKAKGAQEAHEAIRPAGDSFRTPGQLSGQLARDEFRLYELIWQRTVASQMADAVGQTVSIRLAGRSATDEAVEFTASGRTITFPGFLRAYVESRDEGSSTGDDDQGSDDAERRLPRVERGQQLDTQQLDAKGHTTSPPSRYTEPSLVARLEELGIGRPSTYASIMQTIQDRGYVWKKGAALVPSFVAFAVVNLLEQHFAQLVDYDFTASLEEELDEIAGGNLQRVTWLTEFYFGGEGGHAGAIAQAGGLKQVIGQRLEEIDARGVNSIPLRATGPGGEPVVVRVGRYGPYLQAGEDGGRVSIPEDLAPDELTDEKVRELLEAPSGDRELGTDPESGHPVVVKAGRYGPYVTTVVPEGSKESPRTGSLFASMSPETVTLEDALKLLSLPRTVGVAPDGEEIQALNGRYGPYLKKGSDSRSIEGEEKLFTTTLEEALAIFAQPKQRGRAAAKAPLKELGNDPVTEGTITVREGRFGPYVTDGETNASLRKGDDVETITLERAAELLADRRAAGPAKKKATKKSTAKKTTAKKTAAKKAPAKKKAAAPSDAVPLA